MKRTLLLILGNICLFSFTYGTQIFFWTQNFNQNSSGCLPNSSPYNWSVTNIGGQGANANDWYIHSSVESQAHSCFSLNTDTSLGALFIGFGITNCDSADIGAYYKKGCDNTTNKRVESPLIDCTGKSDITLDFDILSRNFFQSDFGSAFISYDGGATWDTLEYKINSGYCPSSTFLGIWEHRSLLLPDSANDNPNVKISFTWSNNDDCFGAENSIAIDNISLSINCELKVGIETIIVDDVPILEFCAGTEYSFRAESDKPIDNVSWNFGNGQFSNDSVVEITYSNPGTYSIELFITDTNGCTGTAILIIHIHGFNALIELNNDTICPYDCIEYAASVTPLSILGIPNQYSWIFVDGTPGSSNAMNPENCYTHSGTYITQLTVTNPNTSCTASDTALVKVDTCNYPVLSQIFASPDFQICVGGCIDFSSNAYDAISYSWSFTGAATTTSSSSSPTHICYPNAGNYNVTLTVTNATGSISLTQQISVYSYPPTPVISLMYSGSDLTGVVCNVLGPFMYQWYFESTLGVWDPLPSAPYTPIITTLIYLDYNYKIRVMNRIAACYSESNELIVPSE